MRRRHELSDVQWAVVSKVTPPEGRRGGRWRDHRDVVNGLFWTLSTDSPGVTSQARWGPWQTICDLSCAGGATACSTSCRRACTWMSRSRSAETSGVSTAPTFVPPGLPLTVEMEGCR